MSDLNSIQTEFAAKFRITLEEYKLLVTHLSLEEIYTCLEILKTIKHRSMFRLGLEKQIRTWFSDTSARPKPLSPNQFKAAKPKWPTKYNLPVKDRQ